jgi:leucine-rich repeat protein SHOC2
MEQEKLEKIIRRAKRNRLLTLNLSDNQITSLPESIGNLTCLIQLDLSGNHITSLSESIGNLTNLTALYLDNNQITSLPENIGNLTYLTELFLSNNPIIDLSILTELPSLRGFIFMRAMCASSHLGEFKLSSQITFVDLPCRYWTKFSNWRPEWLLDEDNAEIRRILIAQVGYEKICEELNAITIDTWREYTLLRIDDCEKFTVYIPYPDLKTEPMVLLKMTCPSTAHIHILRVPPEMVSAQEAITWVNHGIHPDKFSVQT